MNNFTSFKEQADNRDSQSTQKPEIMFISGMSGAGKSTTLQILEDLGWETIDNFPVNLVDQLLDTPRAQTQSTIRPMAVGFDSRTRGFDPIDTVDRIETLRNNDRFDCHLLFLDCNSKELARRYNETRRRHPLAQDKPASQGIAEERDRMQGLRAQADSIIDTSLISSSELSEVLYNRFTRKNHGDTIISISSFGFARGMPPVADLVFDMRFLQNPHWIKGLREKTGLDQDVGDYIEQDPAYEEAVNKIIDLLLFLIPQYQKSQKSYVNIAIGCTWWAASLSFRHRNN